MPTKFVCCVWHYRIRQSKFKLQIKIKTRTSAYIELVSMAGAGPSTTKIIRLNFDRIRPGWDKQRNREQTHACELCYCVIVYIWPLPIEIDKNSLILSTSKSLLDDIQPFYFGCLLWRKRALISYMYTNSFDKTIQNIYPILWYLLHRTRSLFNSLAPVQLLFRCCFCLLNF